MTAIKPTKHIVMKQNISKAINVYDIIMFVSSCCLLLVGVALLDVVALAVVLVDDITGPVKEYQ